MPRIKAWSINALLSASVVVVVLFLAEGVLRLTPYANINRSVGEVPGYYTYYPYDIRPRVATTTHTFADGSYPVWSNSLGCFDVEYSGEEPYVLLSGDSFAWGYAAFQDKWGTLLEHLIKQRVIKCGVSGYGTKQELIKTTQVVEKIGKKPRLLIVNYFGNDAVDDLNFSINAKNTLSSSTTKPEDDLISKYCVTYVPSHPVAKQATCFLRKHSLLYRLFQQAIKAALPEVLLQRIGYVETKKPLVLTIDDMRENLKNILAFKEFASRNDAQLLFVVIPTKEEVSQTEPMGVASAWYIPTEQVDAFLTLKNIDHIDPTETFRKARKQLYWKIDGHLNPDGNWLLSLIVAQHIAAGDSNRTLSKQLDALIAAELH